MNRTYKYMLPALYLDKQTFILLSSLQPGIVGAYISKDDKVSEDSVYVQVDTNLINKDVLEVMVNSHIVKSSTVTEDSVLLEIPHKREGLTEKFLEGKYSEMYPREVVLYKFPYPSQSVLTKNGIYKTYLEDKLNIELGDVELDSIPDLQEENINTNGSSVNRAETQAVS